MYATEPGKGQLVTQALAERATSVAYGMDTSRPDKILAQLGYTGRVKAAAQRKEAAAKAAKDAADAEAAAEAAEAARREPPAGRSARPGRAGG